ncbi:MAG TPA: PLAT/LH2 domain-containing protein [Gemmatimonadales bacterium]|jgi:hypothetical protein
MSKQVPLKLVQHVARELLISFKKLPGFREAGLGAMNPVYNVDGETVAYYEIKFTSKLRPNSGYAIVAATQEDVPIMEFSDSGLTHFERFSSRIKQPFRMIRFGPTFMAAESAQGELLMGIGEPPGIAPQDPQLQIRTERRDGPRQGLPARRQRRPPVLRGEKKAAESYNELKEHFRPRRPSRAVIERQWSIVRSPQSPCLNNYYGVMRPDIFEQGQSDRFTLKDADIGDLRKLRIRHDNSGQYPGWFLEEIRVLSKSGREWVFPCHRWLATDEDDGKIDRLLTLNPQVTYTVSVETGSIDGGGTDANVFLTIHGSEGSSSEVELDNPGHDDFEQGQTDVFQVPNFDLGELSSVRIRHNDSGRHAGWFLEQVRVQNPGSGREWVFPCHRWLATDEDDGKIDRLLTLNPQVTYTVSVETGNIDSGGTDANVFLTIYGSGGSSSEVELDNPGHNDFEQGQTDVFQVTTLDLGELTRLRIRHDNTGYRPAWFLNKIEVRHNASARSWTFTSTGGWRPMRTTRPSIDC